MPSQRFVFSLRAYFYILRRSLAARPAGRHDRRIPARGGGEPTGICAKDQSFIYGLGEVRRPSVRPSVLFLPPRAMCFARVTGPIHHPVDTRQQYITRPTVQTGASLSAPLPAFPARPPNRIPTSALIPAAGYFPRAHLHITSTIPPKNLAAPSDVRLDGRRSTGRAGFRQIYDFRALLPGKKKKN